MPAVVLDLRQATRLRTTPSGLRWALAQQRARGVAVCLLTSDPAANRLLSRYADVFATLEDALWWLEEHTAGESATTETAPPESPPSLGVQ